MTDTVGITGAVTDRRRLRVVGRIDLDDPVLRAELDRVAARLTTRTGLPAGGVIVVLDSAQVFAGASGLPGWLAQAGGTPIQWSICATIVASGRPLVLTNALADPRQATNPLVSNHIIGSYAGVPVTVAGHTVGAVCLIGGEPHTFTDDEMQALHDAAAEAEILLTEHTDPR